MKTQKITQTKKHTFLTVRESQVSYKPTLFEFPQMQNNIKTSQDSAEIIRRFIESYVDIEHREVFVCLSLNRRNKPISINLISIGGVEGTVSDPKIIFQQALLSGASAIIVGHNHPSGNTSPSEQDRITTKKLVEGGKLLSIALLDSLIITPQSYTSFADDGLLY